jgi:hypothetical protein
LLVVAVIVLAISPQATFARKELQGDSISAVVVRGATLLGSTSVSSAERFRVRPAVLSLSGDGTAFVGGPGWKAEGRRVLSFGRIVWKSFGGPKARGEGLLWLNDCTPDCAAGTFRHYPAVIRASSVVRRHYTRLSVTSTSGSRRSTDTYELKTTGPSSSWQLRT